MAKRLHPHRRHPRGHAERARLRGMPEDRQRLAAFADLPHLRPCRLLRRFTRTSTRQNISTPPAIRSSKATIRRKAGAGAMSTRCCSICRTARRRITDRSRAIIEKPRSPAPFVTIVQEIPAAPAQLSVRDPIWLFQSTRRSILRVVASIEFENGECVMVLGMSLATFTLVHVIISLIAIVAGHYRHVRHARLAAGMPGMTAIFLLFTILTSATGFLFPFEGFSRLTSSPGCRWCCWRSPASRSTA